MVSRVHSSWCGPRCPRPAPPESAGPGRPPSGVVVFSNISTHSYQFSHVSTYRMSRGDSPALLSGVFRGTRSLSQKHTPRFATGIRQGQRGTRTRPFFCRFGLVSLGASRAFGSPPRPGPRRGARGRGRRKRASTKYCGIINLNAKCGAVCVRDCEAHCPNPDRE